MRSLVSLLAPALSAAVLSAAVPAATSGAGAPAPEPLRQEEAPEAQQEEPAQEPPLLAIRAGRVIVAPGRELENVTVLVRGDVIQAVGGDVWVPPGTETVEAAVVCAGFVDPWSALGVDRGSLFDRSVKASTRSADALEVYGDRHLREAALRAGVTTVRAQVGLASDVQGTSVALRLFPDPTDERAVLDGRVALSLAVSGNDALERVENVDRLLGQVESGAAYRRAQRKFEKDLAEWEKKIAELEEQLEKDFKKKKKDRDKALEEAKEEGKEFKEERYSEDRKPKPPRFDADGEVLGAVAEGELPVVLELHRVPEMRQLLARLPEFTRVRPILAGVSDARFVADDLAALGATVIVDPTAPSQGGAFGADHLRLAAELDEAGVEVVFGSGGRDPGRTAALPMLAARAVAHGLSREAALHALTLGPARALDLSDRIGSVEPGKQADLLLLSGDPFSSTTRVERVLLAGTTVLTADE